MKKVSFFLPSLNGGGAERVTVNLINNLVELNVDVHLVLIKKQGVFLQDVSEKVKIIDLSSKRAAFSIFPLVNYLNNENPDYLISSLNYLNVIALLAKKFSKVKTKFYITEHSTISQRLKNLKGTGKLVPMLMRNLYNGADRIICVSKGIQDDLISALKLNNPNICVIYNPIDFKKIEKLKTERIEHPFFCDEIPVIIGVGRLIPEKNFELLINAFLEVRKYRICKLIILGSGPLEKKLKDIIQNSDHSNDIALVGFQKNPYAWMNQSEIFVLSSLTEGLPTVLIEAMSVGCKVISTDCPSGPKEIILSSQTGVLVPNNNLKILVNEILNALDSKEIETKPNLKIFEKNIILSKYLEIIF